MLMIMMLFFNFTESKIDLVVIGPELPLTKGLSNLLMNNAILVFGPDQMGAN